MEQLGGIGGFSLHARVSVNTRECKKLERICLSGPADIFPVPHDRQMRLELTDQGMLRYALKTVYRDGNSICMPCVFNIDSRN